ncbi:unnamed protein product [Diamesa tonsa]
MGLLTEGTPLSWEETIKLSKHVRDHGVQQFIKMFSKLRDRTGDVFKWVDEIEYMIVRFDEDQEVVQVSLRSSELLAVLNEKEIKDPDGVESLWRPEYGAYMIEGTLDTDDIDYFYYIWRIALGISLILVFIACYYRGFTSFMKWNMRTDTNTEKEMKMAKLTKAVSRMTLQ